MSYVRCNYDFYDYKRLNDIPYLRRKGRKHKGEKFNNLILMLDTETSKSEDPEDKTNHIVAFTISGRYKHENLFTIWGHKPSEVIEAIKRIMEAMSGNRTIIYVHNLAYDYLFLRKFLFREFGHPKALNTKPHYPVTLEFTNGLILKDSLILAQKSLEKWAIDLNVEHKKAVGKWDYDLIRHQEGYRFTKDELDYIENDTLAGVECLDVTMRQTHHLYYALPLTATGIVREEARKISKDHRGHEAFIKISADYDVYLLLEQCFHGGYTHANRHYIDELITGNIRCYDFTSSYPYVMLTERFPMTKFKPFRDASIDELIQSSEKYAFITRLILVKPRIKNHVVMPILQMSKAVRSIDAVADNGRLLCAGYFEIIVDEQTLALIKDQYDWDLHLCIDTYYSRKAYLPKWYTDYVFTLFEMKSTLKESDPLNYMLAKGKLNSCFGMCVQRAIQDEIEEDYETGEYIVNSKYNEDEYNKYLKNFNKFLPYQWGCWVTAYAQTNLFYLGSLCKEWYYSDTDSVYGSSWDDKKLKAYNRQCLKRLRDRGYDRVFYNDKYYTLGVAELDGEYSEFKTLGAKRYSCRSKESGELKITVAGVPKKKGVLCLNNNINNFSKGFIFSGNITGKKTHTYIYVDEITINKYGDEIGDSIDLSPCDYLLDDITVSDWEKIFEEEILINVYSAE